MSVNPSINAPSYGNPLVVVTPSADAPTYPAFPDVVDRMHEAATSMHQAQHTQLRTAGAGPAPAEKLVR